MNISPQLQAALFRAAGLALTAAVVCGATAMLNGVPFKTALIYALAAAGASLGYRGVAEGAYDANRQAKGLVKPSDVKGVK